MGKYMIQLPVNEISLPEGGYLPDYVRRMRLDDIDQVLEIDREAFPTEWPPPDLKRELDNRLAHYVVACRSDEIVEKARESGSPPDNGFTSLLTRLRMFFGGNKPVNNKPEVRNNEVITGFAGFWIMVDEAHITSIATGGEYCGQGIGEILLQSVFDIAADRLVRVVTLEVRVSNSVAQSLYTKYGFNEVGLRRGYYTDNREDAIIMTTDQINSKEFIKFIRELKQSYLEKWGVDRRQLAR